MWEARGCCVHIGDQWAGGESGLGQEASDAFCWREDVGRWRSVRGVFALPLVPGERRGEQGWRERLLVPVWFFGQ